jgi:hypothetical protein
LFFEWQKYKEQNACENLNYTESDNALLYDRLTGELLYSFAFTDAKKEDNSFYTESEIKQFLVENTFSSNSSSTGGSGGDASSANQVITNSKLTSIDAKTPALVSGAVPVSQNITKGLGAVDSNTQRVTLASDGPAVTGIQSIDAKTPALVSNRVPVDGSGVTQPISAASLPLPSGAATEATLSALNSKYPALGQQTMASSSSVVIASNQSTIPANLITVTSSGNITTQNLVPSGIATAGSAIEISLSGAIGLSIQVTGTYTGALSLQGTSDGTTWITIGGTPLLNVGTGALSANIPSATQSIFQSEVAGFVKARITALAAVTGTAVITLIGNQNTSIVGLDTALPSGSNIIGALTANQSVNIAQVGGTTTVNGGLAGVQAVGGNIAHSAPTTANPVPTGGRIIPTTIATIDTSLLAGDTSWMSMTTGYQNLVKQNATSELDFNFIFQTVATTTTPQTLVQASGTALVRNYIKSLKVQSDTLGAPGTVYLLDGALTVSSIAITTGLTTTSVAHDLKIGDAVVFTALAAGTGVTTNTVYYVTAVGSTTTFNFSLSIGGANVVPSVAYTGTTMYRILDQIRLQTTALQPTVTTYEEPLKTNPNMAVNFLIPTSLTSGNIYLTTNGYRGF